jgi:hypothetical protein
LNRRFIAVVPALLAASAFLAPTGAYEIAQVIA